jgi:hypothetical protein
MTRKRLRWLTVAAATAALLVPGPIAAAAPVDGDDPGIQAVLWAGDPSLGPARNFLGLEQSPGRISVGTHPVGGFGPSFRYETWDWGDGKERCESRGLRRPDGSIVTINSTRIGETLYLGWRARYEMSAPSRWVSVFQLHISGRRPGEPGAGPYVLRTLGDGRLHFQYTRPNGQASHIWSAPFRTGVWETYVIGFRVSRGSDGWTSFWHNGAPQRFTNGDTRFPGPTLMGNYVNVKWGVYRSGPNSGRAVSWINRPRLGTTYADVAP